MYHTSSFFFSEW